jgi:hypothetical protein
MEPKQIMIELQKPFPAEDIEFRVSHAVKGQNGAKALILAYVTNRAIMERLDEVFGVNGWRNEYQEWRDKGVLCTISCKVEGEWVPKSDGADTTDMEATKGGFSASMKRTAVQWGIGRYLYNLEDLWVPVKDRGQKYIKTQTKQREEIKGYWDVPKLPTWALPEGYVQRIKEQAQEETHPEEPQNEQSLEVDPDLAAIEQASKEMSENNKVFVEQKQISVLWGKAYGAGYKSKIPELFEVITGILGYPIERMDQVEKKDWDKLCKQLDAQKIAS